MLALLPVLNSVYKRRYIAISVKFKKILNMHKYRVDGSNHEILLATNILEVENSLEKNQYICFKMKIAKTMRKYEKNFE